jgi:hypothetical protein
LLPPFLDLLDGFYKRESHMEDREHLFYVFEFFKAKPKRTTRHLFIRYKTFHAPLHTQPGDVGYKELM